MGTVIEVEFVRGLYEAGSGPDRSPSEWPPHPARLFNAMVSVAETEAERAALRWLEEQPPPDVHVTSDFVACGGRQAFVPTNRVERSHSYGDLPARKALGPVTWNAYSLKAPIVSFAWLADPTDQVRNALADVVSAVPYLGRSTSPVVARLTGRPADGLERYRPTGGDEIGTTLDIPFPGYLDRLGEAYDHEKHAWEVSRRSTVYTNTADAPTSALAGSPYPEMIVLGFAEKRRFAPAHAVPIAARLREAMQSYVDGGPLVLRGLPPVHLREPTERDLMAPRHQVLISGLPFVGSEHATGQLMGIAVMLPIGMEAEDRRLVLRGLRAVVSNELVLGRLGRVRLDPAVQQQKSLRPDRWARAASEWVSALPISANRYIKTISNEALEGDLLRACADLDLPVPSELEVSRGPMISGAATISAGLRVRHRGDQAKPSYHARVRFAEPINGPLVLGSMRRYGLGLMMPVKVGGGS